MSRGCILGQMSPHHQIRIHRPQRTRPKIVQTGRSNRGQVTYEFKRGELGTRTDPPRRRLDATPGVPEAPEHKREHFETMLFAIRSAAKPGDVGGRDAGLSPTKLKVLRGY
jgi:hypothetical protein